MDLFDGQGVEFHHLQRMQQLRAANETNRLLQQAREEEARLPKCPHCGGAIPGRHSVCKHCRRELYWGPNGPFATAAQAANDEARSKREAETRRREAAALEANRLHEEAEKKKYATRSGGIAVLACLISIGTLIYAWSKGSVSLASYGGHAFVASVFMAIAINDMRHALFGAFISPLLLLVLGCVLAWWGFSGEVIAVSYLLVIVPVLLYFGIEVASALKQEA